MIYGSSSYFALEALVQKKVLQLLGTIQLQEGILLAILSHIVSLRLAYLSCDKQDRENMIKDKLNIPGRKGVQKALSKKISELFNAASYS